MSFRSRLRPAASVAAGLALVASATPPLFAQPDVAPDSDGAASFEATDDSAASAGADAEASATETWTYADDVESETGLWIVQYDGPALAAHSSAVEEGLTSLSADAYEAQLEADHDSAISSFEQTLGRSVEPEFTYLNVLNGAAFELSTAEAKELAALPEVVNIWPDEIRELETDVSHEIILSDAIWTGEGASDIGTRGEGVIIGFLDTGVNPEHPSFAEEADDGFVHENPADGYFGVCDPANALQADEDICNDKLIGAYSFNPVGASARDTNDHGSHVGGTIAGTSHTANVRMGTSEIERFIEGVAPRANAISYLVCRPGCPGAASIASVNQAIADDVDVLNYSISGSDSPWTDPVDLAFLDAYEAGIIVAASAGNAGPGAGTMAKSGPWNSSTAATTHHRIFANDISIVGAGEDLQELPGFPGAGPAPDGLLTAELVDAATTNSPDACTAFTGDVLEGNLLLVPRGNCTFPEKVEAAQDAGAVGVVMYNNIPGPPSSPGGLDGTTIPTVMLSQEDGLAVQAYLADNEGAEASFAEETTVVLNEEWIDYVAAFSSRGPSQYDMLVPTYAAPGVNILAAGRAIGDDIERYIAISGTSMSSPHAAGASALLVALYPDLSPSEIRSVLASTADYEGLVKEDGVTPTDAFDVGSGRINLDNASRAGLVMHETHANFVAANPALGGDPKTLNLPAFVDRTVAGSATWERTVENISEIEVTYTASYVTPEGISLEVTPSTFTLAPGASQDLTLEVSASEATSSWTFGRLVLSSEDEHRDGVAVADHQFPVAVIATEAVAELTVDPESIESTQPTDTVTEHELVIGNTGGATLEWEFIEGSDGSTVIFEQPLAGTNGIVSDHWSDLGFGVYSADDFSLSSAQELTSIETPGFWPGDTIEARASAIDWAIYADDDGRPAGSPVDGSDSAVWAYTSTPTGAGVGVADNTISLDVVAATGDTVNLEPGIYWLTVYPTITSGPDLNDRWNWYQGEPSGASAHLIDPSNAFGAGATDWTPFSGVGVPWNGLAFTLEGAANCGADWLSVAPASGTTSPGGESPVTVTIDTAGVADGEYTADLCIESNDSANPVTSVPVTVTVADAPPAIEVDPASIENSQVVDTVTEHTLTIDNVGGQDLEFEIGEAEVAPPGDGAGVQIQPAPQGWNRSAEQPDTSTEAAPAQVLPTVDPLATAELVENFDDITTLPGAGWAQTNNSNPVGTSGWFQGNPAVFPAHEGAEDSYIGANFNSAGLSPGHISNWLLTPELVLENGAEFSFWTRSSDSGQWADRLEVRLSTEGDSTDVGSDWESVGDFTGVLTVVNEDLAPDGYPQEWTEITVTIDELEESTTGRIGLRYFVPNGGPLGTASDYIGIDTLAYTAPVEPHTCELGTDIPWLSAAPASGTITPGDSAEVTVSLDSTGLELGEYTAQLCVTSNDPATPLVEVPVTLTVTDQPEELDINRIWGSDRYATAANISAEHHEPGLPVVYLATGYNFPDALTGSALAGHQDAPVLLTRGERLPAATAAELARLQPEAVVVLGGPDAIQDPVLAAVAAAAGTDDVTRLAGSNRFATAAAISQQFGDVDTVYIATGANFPDALAGAAWAGAQGEPVLLVRTSVIPSETVEELERLGPDRIVILGGPRAVSDDVEEQLAPYADEVDRLDGGNRFDTAVLISSNYDSADPVYLASARAWPDALAGAALAAREELPLLLTRPDYLPVVIGEELERLSPTEVVIFGGPDVVTQDVVDDLNELDLP